MLKILLAVSAFVGVCLNIMDSEEIVARLSYFTNLGNLAAGLFYTAWLSALFRGRNWESSPAFPPCRLALLVSLLLIGLVYHFVLAPSLEHSTSVSYNASGLANGLVHSLVPFGALADWLFFDVKGRFRPGHCLYVCIPPLAYLGYVIVYTALGGRFLSRLGDASVPYFFLNVEKLGLPAVAMWCAGLFICVMAMGGALTALDALFARCGVRRIPRRK